jgi:hypothetical protein
MGSSRTRSPTRAVGKAARDLRPGPAEIARAVDVRPAGRRGGSVHRRVGGAASKCEASRRENLLQGRSRARRESRPSSAHPPSVVTWTRPSSLPAHNPRAVQRRGREGIDHSPLRGLRASVSRYLPTLGGGVQEGRVRSGLMAVQVCPPSPSSTPRWRRRRACAGRWGRRGRAPYAGRDNRRRAERDGARSSASVGAAVVAAEPPAVHDVGIERIGGDVPVLLDPDRMPLAEGDLPVVAAALDADGSALPAARRTRDRERRCPCSRGRAAPWAGCTRSPRCARR